MGERVKMDENDTSSGENNVLAEAKNNQNQVEEIKESYEYENINGKIETNNVRVLYFPNRRLSTFAEAFIDKDTGKIQTEIVEKGMTEEDILRFFHKKNGSLNLTLLIRSILYEAYRKERFTYEGGNIRHLWYTHFKPVLTGVFGYSESETVSNTIGVAWRDLVEVGLVTYEGLNITSEKESEAEWVIRDTPYPNIIIALEKKGYFKPYQWIPKLFNCFLMGTGGDLSRAVVHKYIRKLKEEQEFVYKQLGKELPDEKRVLNQTFYICTATDYDVKGYDIQDTCRRMFNSAIKQQGGTGHVEIHRLFVRPDQVTKELILSEALPWEIEKKSTLSSKKRKALEKQETTLWNRFCRYTKTLENPNGGLYIPKPSRWNGHVETIGDKEMVRAIIEMDAFSLAIIGEKIIEEVFRIIRDKNLDESKIMVPEVMRIFDDQKKDVAEEIYEKQDEKLIQPLRDKFERDTYDWEEEIDDEKSDSEKEIDSGYDSALSEKDREKLDQEPELFDELYGLEEEIELFEDERDDRIKNTEKLYNRLIEELRWARNAKVERIGNEYEKPVDDLGEKYESVEEEIDDACEDIDEEIEELEAIKDDELEKVEEDYEFKMEQYNKFKEEHLATFNPIEEALKEDVYDTVKKETDYRYKYIEKIEPIRDCLSSLVVDEVKQELKDDNEFSCFDSDIIPTFQGEDYLVIASANKDENIGKVRDGFSSKFINEMKKIVHDATRKLTFKLTKTVEMPDLEEEIEKAKEETEEELKEKEENE